jgi:hypothetical protein
MTRPRKRKLSDEERDELDLMFREWFTNVVGLWANAENWFVGVCEILLRTERWQAWLVMSSMTSTRARVEFVQRLAIMVLPHARQIRHLNKLCKEFKAVSELRNRLVHSHYTFGNTAGSGDVGAVTHLRFVNFHKASFDGTNPFDERDLDWGLINEMRQMARRAAGLTVRLERFCRTNWEAVLELPRDTPLPPDAIHKTRSRPPRRGKRRAPKRRARSSPPKS